MEITTYRNPRSMAQINSFSPSTDTPLSSKRDTSPSVTSSHLKQAHSPDDEIDPQIVKAQKLYESQGRPKAKDYDDVTQEILAIAITNYCCLICTDTPFPDHSKELQFVTIAWRIAYKKMDVKLEMTPELVKMVCVCLICWFVSADKHFGR
jgi:hypothetical protein